MTPTPPPFNERTALLCAEAFEKRLSGIYVKGYTEIPKIIRDACTVIASLRQDLADSRAELEEAKERLKNAGIRDLLTSEERDRLQREAEGLRETVKTYREALEWISTVNACDHEYVNHARSALSAAKPAEAPEEGTT